MDDRRDTEPTDRAPPRWRAIMPWAAAIGAIVGVVRADFVLLLVAVLLFAGTVFWRREPPTDET